MDMDVFKSRILTITGEKKQNKIAAELNVSESKISRWFSGAVLPTLDDLLYISQKYKCSIDWLVGNEVDSKQGLSVYSICKILAAVHPVDRQKTCDVVYSAINEFMDKDRQLRRLKENGIIDEDLLNTIIDVHISKLDKTPLLG